MPRPTMEAKAKMPAANEQAARMFTLRPVVLDSALVVIPHCKQLVQIPGSDVEIGSGAVGLKSLKPEHYENHQDSQRQQRESDLRAVKARVWWFWVEWSRSEHGVRVVHRGRWGSTTP